MGSLLAKGKELRVDAQEIGMLLNVVQAAAVCGGVWIAWKGLQTWRAQLKGTTEYELARNLLRSVYKTKEAINHLRAPFRFIRPSASPAEQQGARIKDWEARAKVFVDAFEELRMYRLEAEVVFGDRELSECAKEFLYVFNEVMDTLNDYLYDKNLENAYSGPSKVTQEAAKKQAATMKEYRGFCINARQMTLLNQS